MNPPDAINHLCLACGLCCNGVLFRDVELQATDDLETLQKLGLTIRPSRSASRTPRFAQPCAALCSGNQCRIYAERPKRCRDFDCGVLKEVIQGELEVDDALRLIRRALRHANRIKSLLRQLGDSAEHLPLARRFSQTRRRIESEPHSEEAADSFAELTLEVHHLNLLTYSRFYASSPGGTMGASG